MTLEGFLTDGPAAVMVLSLVVLELCARAYKAVGRDNRGSSGSWLSPLVAGTGLAAALVTSELASHASWAPEVIGIALTVSGIAHLAGTRQRWS
ncbi:MAG: hypothetical protein AAGG55_08325 [Pseudomonadota bacterium]